MSDALEQKAVEVITQLQHMAPHATDLALQSARMDAIASGVNDLVSLAVAIAIMIVWRKIYWPWVKAYDGSEGGDIARFLTGIVLVVAGSICGFVGLFGLSDPWLYAAYFHPELWLAHKIIG